MAKAQISSKGNRVLLSMTFTEFAAVEALLCRVDEGTNAGISEATIMVWQELRNQRDLLESAGLLPDYFDAFRAGESSLRDPNLDEMEELEQIEG